MGSPEWLAEYRSLEGGRAPGSTRFERGTIDHLCESYYRSQDFNGQGETSQAKNRSVIEAFREGRGDRLVGQLTFEHLDAILARTARKRPSDDGKRSIGGPAAAQRLKKQLRRLFQHAVRLELIRTNPVELTAPVKYRSPGFHSWSEEEIAQFQARHPLGSKARLALEIFLWTMQRRGDGYRLGPGHVKGGRIQYTQEKTGKTLWLPMAPQLKAAIDAMPAIGLTTFLVTEAGKPFSKAGFGNWFRARCDEADLPHCAAHGLRKAGARRLAEASGTQRQIKAVGGWTNDREVQTYTAGADQARLAIDAMDRLVEAHPMDNPVPPNG